MLLNASERTFSHSTISSLHLPQHLLQLLQKLPLSRTPVAASGRCLAPQQLLSGRVSSKQLHSGLQLPKTHLLYYCTPNQEHTEVSCQSQTEISGQRSLRKGKGMHEGHSPLVLEIIKPMILSPPSLVSRPTRLTVGVVGCCCDCCLVLSGSSAADDACPTGPWGERGGGGGEGRGVNKCATSEVTLDVRYCSSGCDVPKDSSTPYSS